MRQTPAQKNPYSNWKGNEVPERLWKRSGSISIMDIFNDRENPLPIYLKQNCISFATGGFFNIKKIQD